MKLIVGLGNPGREYTATRHNAGTWWISRLADQLNITLKAEPRFHGLCARIGQGESELWLLNPQTYMNASGRAVAALCRFYKIEPEQVLVVHDELDLPPGTSRLKLDGGLGGTQRAEGYRRASCHAGFLALAHRHRASRRQECRGWVCVATPAQRRVGPHRRGYRAQPGGLAAYRPRQLPGGNDEVAYQG